MERILVVIAVITLISNIWFFHRMLTLTAANSRPSVIIYKAPEAAAAVLPVPETIITPEPLPTADNSRYQAWVNRKNIPVTVSSTPAPPVVKPVLEPLARPGGFV